MRTYPHGDFDPDDPPEGRGWCSHCEHWDEDCVCPDDAETQADRQYITVEEQTMK